MRITYPQRLGFGNIAFMGPTSVDFSGAGKTTLMGESAIRGHIDILAPADSCQGGFSVEDHLSIWADNGDRVDFVLIETVCPVELGILHGVGRYGITGGTGRFDGATGRGTVDGNGDFNQGRFNLAFSGTISRLGG